MWFIRRLYEIDKTFIFLPVSASTIEIHSRTPWAIIIDWDTFSVSMAEWMWSAIYPTSCSSISIPIFSSNNGLIPSATLYSEWKRTLISAVNGLLICSLFFILLTANSIWSANGKSILLSIFPNSSSALFKTASAISKQTGETSLTMSSASPLSVHSFIEYTVSSALGSTYSVTFLPNPMPFPKIKNSWHFSASIATTALWFNAFFTLYIS